MNRQANIIGWDNRGGLSRDIDVLEAALTELGWSVAINGRRKRRGTAAPGAGRLDRARLRITKTAIAAGLAGPPFDLNLHLEEISAIHLALARRNVLIPNQEWFRDWCRPHLPRMDEVWAKTRAGEKAFTDLGCNVSFLGWAGVDRRVQPAASKTLMGLHVAGASPSKGTEAVLDVWSENPDWPRLRVLRRTRGYAGEDLSWRSRALAPNIRIIPERVDEHTLSDMQNESAICLCPSEVEGFGHNILEAMSVGAVVITTDGPPMNELVTAGTGLLAAAGRSEPMSLGRRYFVDRADLARQIRAALAMTDGQRDALGKAARARFEENNAAFRIRLKHHLQLLQETAGVGRQRSGGAPSSLTQTPMD